LRIRLPFGWSVPQRDPTGAPRPAAASPRLWIPADRSRNLLGHA